MRLLQAFLLWLLVGNPKRYYTEKPPNKEKKKIPKLFQPYPSKKQQEGGQIFIPIDPTRKEDD